MWPFTKPKPDNRHSDILSLNLDVSENTDFKFTISLYDISEPSAEKIAKSIYAFNKGLLFPYIVDLLLAKAKEGATMEAFVSLVFEHLNEYYDTEKPDLPLVPPTEAFKKLNITQKI